MKIILKKKNYEQLRGWIFFFILVNKTQLSITPDQTYKWVAISVQNDSSSIL